MSQQNTIPCVERSPQTQTTPAESPFCPDELAEVLSRAFTSVSAEIDELTKGRPAIRQAIHALAHGLAAATLPAVASSTSSAESTTTASDATASDATAPGPTPVLQAEPAVVAASASAPIEREALADASQIATLQIGGGAPTQSPEFATEARVARPRYSDVTDDDLDMIIQRTRLKAEGARWAVERDERQRDGNDFATEIRPGDQDVIQRAKSLPHCYLWMNQPRGDVWDQADDFLLVADCFDALAESLVTLQATLDTENRESIRKAIDLVAEAQSALRMAVSRVEEHPDSDQQMVYHWLRNRASVERFYIERYMRITDPADPERCDDVMELSRTLRDSLGTSRKLEKQRSQSLGKARYHLNRLTRHDEAFDRGEWEKVVAAIDQVIEDGIPPSNIEIRETLLPHIDHIPDIELPSGFLLVLREIDRVIAAESSVDSRPICRDAPPAVREVAQLLNGRSIVLIGGEIRPAAKSALETAFNLKEVDWIPTREHQSIASFDSHIARPEVALVILAIRWSSHSFGEAQKMCDSHGKPLVRLPAGYGTNQVATQIIDQCGQRLSDDGNQSSVA